MYAVEWVAVVIDKSELRDLAMEIAEWFICEVKARLSA